MKQYLKIRMWWVCVSSAPDYVSMLCEDVTYQILCKKKKKKNSLSDIISCLETRRSEATSAIKQLCFYLFLASELNSRIVKEGGEKVWMHNSVYPEAVPILYDVWN